jgi:hypothetical protein
MKCLLISRANNHTRSFPSPLQQAELDMASPIRLQHWLLSHNISLFWPTLCWLIPQTKLFVIIWHRVLVLNITNYSYLYKTRKGLCFVATGLLVIRLDWRPPRPPKLRGWVFLPPNMQHILSSSLVIQLFASPEVFSCLCLEVKTSNCCCASQWRDPCLFV